MRLPVRPFALAAVCGLAMLCTACGSNNKDQIVGKWKIVSLPEKTGTKQKDEFGQMDKLGIYVYIEFGAGDAVTLGVGAKEAMMLDMIKAAAPGQKIVWNAKYKLQSGDSVELYDLPKEMAGQGGMFGGKDRARVKISINGDNMSMTDEEGTGQLVRVKDEPLAPKNAGNEPPFDNAANDKKLAPKDKKTK